WQWGNVYGSFNDYSTDGERTVQQLAGECLTALGETGFDVSRMPNEAKPRIKWDGDSAADALDKLCSDFGCVVVLNPFTNRVEIWPIGDGVPLPVGET